MIGEQYDKVRGRHERFEETRKESAESLDWSSTTFLGLDWDEMERNGPQEGRTSMDHFFWVRVGDELHTFKMGDVIRVSRGLCTPYPAT